MFATINLITIFKKLEFMWYTNVLALAMAYRLPFPWPLHAECWHDSAALPLRCRAAAGRGSRGGGAAAAAPAEAEPRARGKTQEPRADGGGPRPAGGRPAARRAIAVVAWSLNKFFRSLKYSNHVTSITYIWPQLYYIIHLSNRSHIPI